MNRIVFLLSCVLFSALLSAQHDSLVVIKLKLIPDTTVGGVQGVSVMLSMKHIYDSLYHDRPVPATVYAEMEVLHKGKPVPAVKSTGSYKLRNKTVGYRTQPQTHGVTVKTIHIPYYAMDVVTGKYDVSFRLTCWQNDTTTFAEKGYRIPIKYDSLFHATITVPEKEYFSVMVSGARAMETDFDGKQWDYNMISGAPPDIVWKVLTSESDKVDYFFVSPMMKNSYSAAWLDDSGKLCVSKGDRFYVKVYDNDPMYDDLMASLFLTVDELLDITKRAEDMQLGRLSLLRMSGKRE